MNLFQRIASLWTLSPEAKRVEEELVHKLNMPVEPDYTADLIASKGFTSLNDHQLVDFKYEKELPWSNRVIDIDPSKLLEKELKRVRLNINMRAFTYRRRTKIMEARLGEEWNNLQAVPDDEAVELERMAEALQGAKPQPKVRGRVH